MRFVFADIERAKKAARRLQRMHDERITGNAGHPKLSLTRHRHALARLTGHADWNALASACGVLPPDPLDHELTSMKELVLRRNAMAARLASEWGLGENEWKARWLTDELELTGNGTSPVVLKSDWDLDFLEAIQEDASEEDELGRESMIEALRYRLPSLVGTGDDWFLLPEAAAERGRDDSDAPTRFLDLVDNIREPFLGDELAHVSEFVRNGIRVSPMQSLEEWREALSAIARHGRLPTVAYQMDDIENPHSPVRWVAKLANGRPVGIMLASFNAEGLLVEMAPSICRGGYVPAVGMTYLLRAMGIAEGPYDRPILLAFAHHLAALMAQHAVWISTRESHPVGSLDTRLDVVLTDHQQADLADEVGGLFDEWMTLWRGNRRFYDLTTGEPDPAPLPEISGLEVTDH